MNSEQLILAALEEAHSGSSEVTQGLAAIIRHHEASTGTRLSADNLQLKVEVQQPRKGDLAFLLSLNVVPDKVIHMKKVDGRVVS